LDEDFAARGTARVDPQVLRSLMKKSDRAGFIQLGSHLLALGASGLLLWTLWGSWWGVPVFIIYGALINWLYAAQHESSHDTVFRTRWFNEVLGRFTGFVLLYPRDYDRWQHFTHHRHTQDPERDGELVGDKGREGRFWAAMGLLGVTLWTYLISRMVWHAFAGRRWPGREEYYLSDEQEQKVVAEARWHLAGYAACIALSLVFQSSALVILWWAPMFATAWTHQIQNHIEHGGMPYVADTWRNTRTMKTIAPMRWLSWGMVYHTAHHTYPGVPFHRLADLHRAICDARGEEPVTVSYLPYWWGLIRAIAAPARG
jgi:fatty acid desaturase